MGTDKNIKLHIVTDIKLTEQTTKMAKGHGRRKDHKRTFAKICRDKGASTPEEVMKMNYRHLVNNYDQSPQDLKHAFIQGLRKCTEGGNCASLGHLGQQVKLTASGKRRNPDNFMKMCSVVSSGERVQGGCRNFIDTFMPDLFYDIGQKKCFRKRRPNDPQPQPCMPLHLAFLPPCVQNAGEEVSNTTDNKDSGHACDIEEEKEVDFTEDIKHEDVGEVDHSNEEAGNIEHGKEADNNSNEGDEDVVSDTMTSNNDLYNNVECKDDLYNDY